jgi:predicted glycosyltransferase
MTISNRSVVSTHKRIWIDLDNSPHVPFFAPIIKELTGRGYSVTLTARDAFQVCELADLFRLPYKRVGRHYGKNKILKVLGTCFRALQLLSIAARAKPDLAVSHVSRAQILAARLLGIPSLAMSDYEFAQTNVPFRPTWMMVPAVISKTAIHPGRRGTLNYHGIKEDVYAPAFSPDPSIRSRLGLDEGHVVVTVRPPANEAHYHTPKSDELFSATIEFLAQAPCVKVILVPRNAKQGTSVHASWPDLFSTGKMMIPEHAEDGLNLIWHSDLVISGGGTMNREAAALGVPVYSIFRGKIGAVDRYLAESGRLTLLESAEDVRAKINLERRSHTDEPHIKSAALNEIVDHIVTLVESKG